jgi:hypothetical protein
MPKAKKRKSLAKQWTHHKKRRKPNKQEPNNQEDSQERQRLQYHRGEFERKWKEFQAICFEIGTEKQYLEILQLKREVDESWTD